jgi:hypothetical protein
VYVLEKRSVVDVAVLEYVCRERGLPTPLAPAGSGGVPTEQVLFLERRAGFFGARIDRRMPDALRVLADAAARAAGRKKWDLFPSLYHYENLLPPDWTTRWLRTEGGSDSMLMACPRSWTPGSSVSRQLLLGGGVLVYSTGEVDR